MISEKWLRAGSSDEKFATAIMACMGYKESCMRAEMCLRNRDCFRSNKQPQRKAHDLINALCKDQNPEVTNMLRLAALWILAYNEGSE